MKIFAAALQGESNTFSPWPEPSGPTVQSVYESFREQILEDLSANSGADIVLLYLHGTMVTTEVNLTT